MVTIKNQKLDAYILLESLVALAVLATITTLVLGELSTERKALKASQERQEALLLATMAVQTHQTSLELNGVSVKVRKTGGEVVIYQDGKELLRVKEN